MLQDIWNVIQPQILEILTTILVGVASFIGTKIKAIYKEKVNTETKEKVVNTVVRAVEQLYKDLNGEEKLELCIENATSLLQEKGITITELELRLLIEAVVGSFNLNKKEVINNEQNQ